MKYDKLSIYEKLFVRQAFQGYPINIYQGHYDIDYGYRGCIVVNLYTDNLIGYCQSIYL